MTDKILSKGIYLVWQKSSRKGVDQYGVLDIGNCLRIARVDGIKQVVVHQTPPSITLATAESSGP